MTSFFHNNAFKIIVLNINYIDSIILIFLEINAVFKKSITEMYYPSFD